MRRNVLRFASCLLAVVCVVFVTGSALAEKVEKPEPNPTAQRIAQLIVQLGSRDFSTRESATKQLNELGAEALPSLRKAVSGGDPETVRRAQSAIVRIEKRLESERLIQPLLVRLKVEKVELKVALAELAKLSGFTIELGQGPDGSERITLDTGEVPFWQALDALCRKAKLMPQYGYILSPRRNEGGTTINSMIISGNRVVVTDADLDKGTAVPKVVLVPNSVQPPAVNWSGALMVRTLPADRLKSQPVAEDQRILGLEVTMEPRMRWQKTIGVRLDRAIDDRNQDLSQQMLFSLDYDELRSNIYIRGTPLILDDGSDKQREIILRLRKGTQPTKELKEIRGVLSGQIQTAPQVLIDVDDILNSANKSFLSPAKGTLKIHEVVKEKQGFYQLRVQLTAPPKRMDTGLGAGTEGVTIYNRRALGELEEFIEAPASNFALRDARGNAWKLKEVQSVEVPNEGRYSQMYTVIFEADAGQGAPQRLTYSGWRTAIVDVPFSLKDVPIP